MNENRLSEIGLVISACFDGIPFIRYELAGPHRYANQWESDFEVKIVWSEGRKNRVIRLVGAYKSNLQPRFARLATLEIKAGIGNLPETYPVLIAPSISPSSADICRQAGVGYIDMQGNCHLSCAPIFIFKQSPANQATQKRELRSLYSPKAERVLRVLLNNPQQKWKIKDLANEAEVSLGQAYNVKKMIVDREWMSDKEIRLLLPLALIESWGNAYRSGRNISTQYYSLESISSLEAKIAEQCEDLGLKYAFTGFSAAIRRAPFVRYQRVTVYIDGVTDVLLQRVQVKEVNSGGNLNIIRPYDDGVFYGKQKIRGLVLVSAIQNYLDLARVPNRGEEAARAILEEVIKPQWSNA